MTDPHFRLYVSVYKINKITHGRLEIMSLSSRVQFGLPLEVMPHGHVLFSTSKLL